MKFLVRFVLCLMISFTLVEVPVMKAHAGMITTTAAVAEMTRSEADKTVANFMDRGDVKAQLVKLGVNPVEANKRLAGLSDAEARKLSHDIQTATLGGNIGGILILVLIILAIIYLAKRI